MPPKRSSFGDATAASSIRATPASGCCIRARDLGLPKLIFQVIGRTIATLAKDKGHVKDIQGMMRHSRLATTMEVYMQSLEDGVRTTVNLIHDELRGTWGPGPLRTSRKQVIALTSAASAMQ